MKNYFKKFSVMFVMILVVIGFGTIQNGIVANAATAAQYQRGTQYLQPLEGYSRYDDSDTNITYSNNFTEYSTTTQKHSELLWNKNRTELLPGKGEGTIKFSFYGTSIALIDYVFNDRAKNCTISLDGGKAVEVFSAYSDINDNKYNKTAFYVKNGLEDKRHDVIIKIPGSNDWFCLDAIDIDGKLMPYNDDESTPEQSGNSDSKTGAILIINLNDGETKVFDVSSSEVAKFKSWYNTKSEYENKLTYEFNKTVNSNISIEEHVVHEKITSFEIRKY